MRYPRVLIAILLILGSINSWSTERTRTEEEKRAAFLSMNNGLRADRRLAALRMLENSKEERSFETLYIVSLRDADPEIRSRAFSMMVRGEDALGYIAYLAADSFKQEKDIGVKVEKAIDMGGLKYKWSALNEMVSFLNTLRWHDWYWGWYGPGARRSAGYIASGNPPEVPDEAATRAGGSEGSNIYNREPYRWHNENELIGLITGVINRLSGTSIASRPRIDQEIVKWWERKSDLWAEYDRNLRAKAVAKQKEKETPLKNVKDVRDDDIQPGKDTQDYRSVLNLMRDEKGAKPAIEIKKRAPATVEDE